MVCEVCPADLPPPKGASGSAWKHSDRVDRAVRICRMQGSGIMSNPQAGTRAGPAYTQRASDRIDRMAIWSLVLSILTLGGIGSIAGIWLGAKARARVDQSGERGRGLAIAGIIVGVITLLVAIGYWIVIAKYIGGGHGGGSGGGGGGGY